MRAKVEEARKATDDYGAESFRSVYELAAGLRFLSFVDSERAHSDALILALTGEIEGMEKALRDARDVVQEDYEGAAEVAWTKEQARYKVVLGNIDAALFGRSTPNF